MVAGEDFPGRALLPAPTEALVIDERPITALCVLQVKLREKTNNHNNGNWEKMFVDLWWHQCLYTVGLLFFLFLRTTKVRRKNEQGFSLLTDALLHGYSP